MKKTLNTIIISAVIISMSVFTNAQTLFTEKVGGEEGTSFMLPSTRHDILTSKNITGIAIQHNNRRVEKIVLEYSTRKGEIQIDSAGNDAGEWSFIDLEEGEYIVYISGRAGTLIDQISFHTTLRNTYGPYGGSGGQEFDISIPSNAVVIGFTGKSGPSIQQIGLIYRIMGAKKDTTSIKKVIRRDHRKKNKRFNKKNISRGIIPSFGTKAQKYRVKLDKAKYQSYPIGIASTIKKGYQ